MSDPIGDFWRLRIERCRAALEKNRFLVFAADDPRSAGRVFLERILPQLKVKTASWGDSMTLAATGVLDALRTDANIRFIETFDPHMERRARYERRRQALLADLFLTGSNAVTESGQLVNLDNYKGCPYCA